MPGSGTTGAKGPRLPQLSIKEAADKAAIEAVKKESPSSFTGGATADIFTRRVDAKVSYNRQLRNGLGLTAYLRAWWNDAAILPVEKAGAVVGFEVEKKFPPAQ